MSPALPIWLFWLLLLAACRRGEPPAPSEAPAPPVASVAPRPSASTSAALLDAETSAFARDLSSLNALDGADPKVVAALMKIGFGAAVLPGKGRVVRAHGFVPRQLDADADLEAVAHVRVEAEDGPTKRTVLLYLAFIDGGKIVGNRRFVGETCTYPATFELRLERVHDKAFDDAVVEGETITACDGHAGSTQTTVLTIARGKLEMIFDLRDEFAFTQASGKTLDPKAIVRFDDGGVVIDEEGKGSKELAFDPVEFKYRASHP